jgi:Cep192 domain 4/Abnormal spindle-like microcephaly-assoc'd, ASPM-SPD-2-Hydin/HYDIN/CFA65/VesB-like, Ig-like domain
MLGCGAVQGASPADPASSNYVSANAAKLNFGNVVVGSSQTLITTITNGSRKSVTIQASTVTDTGFSVVSPSLPLTIGGRQSVQFSIRCAPSAVGALSGSLILATTASSPPAPITLSGTGILPGQLSLAPSSLSFGNVALGQTVTSSATFTNSGSTNLTILQLSVNNNAFQLSGMTIPMTLAPGTSASLGIAFKPEAAGAMSGTLSASTSASLSTGTSGSDAGSSVTRTVSIALAGAGAAAGQLIASPMSVSFANAQTGKTATLPVSLTNSGTTPVQVVQAVAAGTVFSVSGISAPFTLQPGQSAAFNVVFAPTASGSTSGTLTVTSNASNPTVSISLSGTATAAPSTGTVSTSPASLSFGNVQAGTSKNQTETLSNSGGSSVTISQANVTGIGFTLTGLDLPLTLSPNQSFTFGVLFAPQASGSASGSIALVSNASSAPSIALSGTGTASGQLTISPPTLSFGNVTVGSSQSLTATLTATGAGVTLSSADVSTSEFALTGLSLPLTLAAGQSEAVNVQFSPQSSGAASASASFISNASTPTTIEALAGTGVAAPQHSVGLSWSQIPSAAGYYVYRGQQSGGPYSKVNSSPDPATSYSDISVQAGQTYFYVTTAVDQSGTESDYSNEVQAVIPSP